MPAPLDPEKRDAIAQAIRDGGKRNEIARQHDVSASTVTKIARELETDEGLTAFDRSATKKASEAIRADQEHDRLRLAVRWRTFSTTVLASLEALTFEDWARVAPLDRARIAGIAVDKAAVLERGADPEADQSQALVAQFVETLRDKIKETTSG